MSYNFNNIQDKNTWNQFVIENPTASFLQSWEWGEFQQSLGRKCWRLKIKDVQCLVIKYDLPLGKNYFYSPHAPLIKSGNYPYLWADKQSVISALKEEIRNIVRKEKPMFWRIEPFWPDTEENKRILKQLHFQKSLKDIQPKETLILDINKKEEELLAQMKPKTRYNIGLAKRKGVKIKQSQDIQDIEIFWKILQQTARRDKFKTHPRQYYEKLLRVQSSQFKTKLFLAAYNHKIIAANLVVFFGRRATYLHGASDYQYRALMAPYLLQWEAIREAKSRGCSEYDFWGISEKKWPGLTRFKKSFGGREINYMGAYDLVFQPVWYRIYKIYNLICNSLKR